MNNLLVRSPGKRSRGAVYKRRLKHLEAVYRDFVLSKQETGKGNQRRSRYLLVEPFSEGCFEVFVVQIVLRDQNVSFRPLIRFSAHATARLMQSAGVDGARAAFLTLRPLIEKLLLVQVFDEQIRLLVIVDPAIGWMPTQHVDDGSLVVKTIVPRNLLSHPHKRALFDRCVSEDRPFLIETRSMAEASDCIGNAPSSLALGPSAKLQ